MRTLVTLLVASFVLGALAWSVDLHVQLPGGDSVVALEHMVSHSSDSADSNGHSEHCGHCTAHFTGLPLASLGGVFHADQPEWRHISVVHRTLTSTPPTPPPDR